MPAPATRMCAACSTADVPLRQCVRCKSVSYCYRDCQKAHWKAHKRACARAAQDNIDQAWPDSPAGAERKKTFKAGEQDKKPFLAIQTDRYLHDREEASVFELLIDTLRLRQEDEYSLGDTILPGSIYDGKATSADAFRTFIKRAKHVSGFLPPWWHEDSAENCMSFACQVPEYSLAVARKNRDIEQRYGDTLMPTKLRMLAERVYGYAPRGERSDQMLDILAKMVDLWTPLLGSLLVGLLSMVSECCGPSMPSCGGFSLPFTLSTPDQRAVRLHQQGGIVKGLLCLTIFPRPPFGLSYMGQPVLLLRIQDLIRRAKETQGLKC